MAQILAEMLAQRNSICQKRCVIEKCIVIPSRLANALIKPTSSKPRLMNKKLFAQYLTIFYNCKDLFEDYRDVTDLKREHDYILEANILLKRRTKTKLKTRCA